jgi:DNA-binding response OmpR family regulator
MNKTILCIEDSLVYAKLLKEYLEQSNYVVHLADDGESGLAMARELSPDMILLDVMLPGIDGFQVCSKIKADDQLKHIPVFMLTGGDQLTSLSKGMETGADDYILKTKPLPEIIAFIADWFQSA